ncbi:MAG: site-specific integrase [Ruminococcus sp.]|nr:site-specific integrase [Ruminococcus sp.]
MGRPKKESPNRSDGRYEVKICVGEKFDGTKIMKSFYSRISKADAKAKAEQYKIEQAVCDITGEAHSAHDMAFDTWARKVLDSLKGTVKDSSFNLTYKNSVENHLIPYFGKRKLSTIRPIDIQGYFNQLQDSYTLETLKKHKMALNKIFESAVQNDIIRKNPCASVKISSKKKSCTKSTYTQEQCQLVLEYAETHRYGLDIILMLSYGITRSELLGVQWQDIDADNRVLHICRGVADVQNVATGKMEVIVGEPKNDFRKREIPLTTSILTKLMQREHSSDFVFCTTSGTVQSPRTWSRRHYDVFMRDMYEYYQQKGIDIPKLKPHELRHTRASLWVNDGANLFAVADVLGHSDLKMLRKRYAHSDVESTRKLLGIDSSDENLTK